MQRLNMDHSLVNNNWCDMAAEQDDLQSSASKLYSGEFLSGLGLDFDKSASGSQ